MRNIFTGILLLLAFSASAQMNTFNSSVQPVSVMTFGSQQQQFNNSVNFDFSSPFAKKTKHMKSKCFLTKLGNTLGGLGVASFLVGGYETTRPELYTGNQPQLLMLAGGGMVGTGILFHVLGRAYERGHPEKFYKHRE